MTTLLVGFDSAWTASNSGAIVSALGRDDGTFEELGSPQIANFSEAERILLHWQRVHQPANTVVMLDQPTIIVNDAGQRPVENIVASAVSLRYGGMQPAHTGRTDMFGLGAPVWPFLDRFGGAANPLSRFAGTVVFETYPVLAMIALRWMLPDSRPTGRLPKYNPDRRKTFAHSDWTHVCRLASAALQARGLTCGARWIDEAGRLSAPRKADQDGLDAYLCLLVGLHLVDGSDCLLVGDQKTGYIVVPHCSRLQAELGVRCGKTGRLPAEWVRVFRRASAR
jgi:predicted RNase H-like nuclease